VKAFEVTEKLRELGNNNIRTAYSLK